MLLEIKMGSIYRRKSDGQKMIALQETDKGYWWFYRLLPHVTVGNYATPWHCHQNEVTEWREPVSKTVVGYVWLGENNSVAIEKYKCGPDRLGIEGTCTEKIIACKRFEVTVRENEYDD